MTTYPTPVKERTLTADEVHQFLRSPALVARRMQEMTDLSFVADLLLTGSADATGTGAIMVEEDDALFLDDKPEFIAPGGEYPLITADEVGASLIAIRKKGFDSEITDEKIARTPGDTLRKLLAKMANTMVADFDSVALAVVASKVTGTYAASGTWTDGGRIIDDILMADATEDEKERGYSYNAIVLRPVDYAKVVANLIKANMMPRESGNPLLANGARSFDFMGKRIIKSVRTPFTDPLLIDTTNLGGIATENIGSPGYARTQGGIEVKTWRPAARDDNDSWRVRNRRVAVPYVTGPGAAVRITGTKA